MTANAKSGDMVRMCLDSEDFRDRAAAFAARQAPELQEGLTLSRRVKPAALLSSAPGLFLLFSLLRHLEQIGTILQHRIELGLGDQHVERAERLFACDAIGKCLLFIG